MELFNYFNHLLINKQNIDHNQLEIFIRYQIYFCSIYSSKLFFLFFILFLNIQNNLFFENKLRHIYNILTSLYISEKSLLFRSYLIDITTIYFVLFDYKEFSYVDNKVDKLKYNFINLLNQLKYLNMQEISNQIIDQEILPTYKNDNIEIIDILNNFEENKLLLSSQLIVYCQSINNKTISLDMYHHFMITELYELGSNINHKNNLVNSLNPKIVYAKVFLKPIYLTSIFISKYFSTLLGVSYLKSNLSYKYQYLNHQYEVDCWKDMLEDQYINSKFSEELFQEANLIYNNLIDFLKLNLLKKNCKLILSRDIYKTINESFNLLSNNQPEIKEKMIINKVFENIFLYNLLLNTKKVDLINSFSDLFITISQDFFPKKKSLIKPINFSEYLQIIHLFFNDQNEKLIVVSFFNDLISFEKIVSPLILVNFINDTYIIWKKKELIDNRLYLSDVSKDFSGLLKNPPNEDLEISFLFSTNNPPDIFNFYSQNVIFKDLIINSKNINIGKNFFFPNNIIRNLSIVEENQNNHIINKVYGNIILISTSVSYLIKKFFLKLFLYLIEILK